MLSMTGFGASRFEAANLPVHVEIKSVNHRHCDVSVRAPRPFNRLEPFLVKLIRDRLHRGRVEISISVAGGTSTKTLEINWEVARQVHEALQSLGEKFDLLTGKQKIDLQLLASFRDIFEQPDKDVAAEELWGEFEKGFSKAVEALILMRQKEGEAIRNHLLESWKTLSGFHEQIGVLVHGKTAGLQERLRESIQTLIGSQVSIDPARLVQEVAYLAERSDVREEINRLDAHLVHLRKVFDEKEPSGRRLDFLIQELNREINTIGSKTDDLEVTRVVVAFKAELERVREQIQNIE